MAIHFIFLCLCNDVKTNFNEYIIIKLPYPQVHQRSSVREMTELQIPAAFHFIFFSIPMIRTGR